MIFYFSATGNSQRAAERIAAALGDRCVSIGVAMRDKHFHYDISGDPYLGFVLPTFAYTLPGIAADFIGHLELTGLAGQQVFGVFTCGEATGSECAALSQVLSERNIPFHGGFDLVMQDNFIPWSDVPAPAAVRRRLDEAEQAIDRIIADLQAGKTGYLGSGVPEMLFLPYERTDSLNGIGKMHADDKCVGCGLCAEMCPMGIIRIENGHAEFLGDCCACFTCLHRCPRQAVQYADATADKGRYVHPDVRFRTRNEY